ARTQVARHRTAALGTEVEGEETRTHGNGGRAYGAHLSDRRTFCRIWCVLRYGTRADRLGSKLQGRRRRLPGQPRTGQKPQISRCKTAATRRMTVAGHAGRIYV